LDYVLAPGGMNLFSDYLEGTGTIKMPQYGLEGYDAGLI
jgi:hypothetical protein